MTGQQSSLSPSPLWKRVEALAEKGYSTGEIAHQLDCSNQQVSNIRWQLRNGYQFSEIVRPRKTIAASRCACGMPKAHRSEVCMKCQGERSAATRQALLDQRGAVLREHAASTGTVPTTSEAAQILGVGRSVAGLVLLAAFGPDTRAGAQRRQPRTFDREQVAS